MASTIRSFVRERAVTYASFVLTSAVAVALSRHTTRGEPLRTPGQLALAVTLILVGSLAVALAENCLDRFLALREEDARVASVFLVVGTATLTVAILVFYTAVYV